MSANLEPVEILEGGEDLFEKHRNDLIEMFNVASFREKWMQVREGLKQPSGSGANKWARLQVFRLLSPAAAVVVPVMLLCMLTLFPKSAPANRIVMPVKIIDQPVDEVLKNIDQPVVEKKPEYIPVEVTFNDFDIEQEPVEVVTPPKLVTLQQSTMNSVAITKCPVFARNIYGHRKPGAQAAARKTHGGIGTDEPVLRALRYLKKNQNSDGSWGKNRVAMTSLALLAYLAHGETSESEEFGSTVQNAVTFIIDSQQEGGRFAGRDSHDYTQPIAAYALTEAYSLINNPNIKAPAIKALLPIIKGQNPSGGFNYNLKLSMRDDSSYMAWCVQALKAAKMAKFEDEIEGLEKCIKKSVVGFQKNYGTRDGYGGFGYTGKGHAESGLTGAGVLCLQFLGASKTSECRGGMAGLSKWEFNWDKPRAGSFLYYMYYTTQAMFQEGGESWKRWNSQFKPGLVNNQDVVGREVSGYVDHLGESHAIGSWISPAKKEHNGGDVIMDTIMCTLMLEVYIRYLPTFMVVPADDADDELRGDTDDVPVNFVDCRLPLRNELYQSEYLSISYM